MKVQVLSLSLALLLGAGGVKIANAGHYQPVAESSPSEVAPDNTGINARDKSAGAVTADSQSNSKNDLELVRDIRNAIENDASLSTDAKNVKVMATNGTVTLRGPVNSAAEKSKIVRTAKSVSGVRRVKDRLEIAGNATSH
jgi:hyperosmotically inducible protein